MDVMEIMAEIGEIIVFEGRLVVSFIVLTIVTSFFF
jgi:hypothetical protein